MFQIQANFLIFPIILIYDFLLRTYCPNVNLFNSHTIILDKIKRISASHIGFFLNNLDEKGFVA